MACSLCDCRKAKLLLKKKHYLEGLLDQTDTQMDNLAQMVVSVVMVTVTMYTS